MPEYAILNIQSSTGNYIMNINTISALEDMYPVPVNTVADVKAYWVPIELHQTALDLYYYDSIKVRVRFRGSRKNSVGREMPCIKSPRTYRRSKQQASQDCLIADATHFTVYTR